MRGEQVSHGKHPRTQALQPRHARLAVGSSAALVTFLYETHLARPKQTTATGQVVELRRLHNVSLGIECTHFLWICRKDVGSLPK